MNTRNVDAIERLLVALDYEHYLTERELAAALASRGVLGPASEVLPDPLCVDLPGGQVMEFYAPGINHALERIARGVA